MRISDWSSDVCSSDLARGKLLAAESLKSDAQATRIESRNGKRAVVDGPFSEAKEMIGGFFLLDCQSHDEALAIAAECPAAEWATVEIRETGDRKRTRLNSSH